MVRVVAEVGGENRRAETSVGRRRMGDHDGHHSVGVGGAKRRFRRFPDQAIAAGSLVNLATILYINSIQMPAAIAYILCVFFSLKVVIGIIKVKKFDQRERLITGTA